MVQIPPKKGVFLGWVQRLKVQGFGVCLGPMENSRYVKSSTRCTIIFVNSSTRFASLFLTTEFIKESFLHTIENLLCYDYDYEKNIHQFRARAEILLARHGTQHGTHVTCRHACRSARENPNVQSTKQKISKIIARICSKTPQNSAFTLNNV